MKPAKLLAILLLVMAASPTYAQYFGRNKVQYRTFNFSIMTSQHFNVYYYAQEEPAIRDMTRIAERWYNRYTDLLKYNRRMTQPLILYASAADFQQTNVIEGLINEATGGVTEGIKDRITIPLTGVNADNNHVIGHELVHGFQYDMLDSMGHGPSAGDDLPLWFVEGMAEYLSLGGNDPLTVMWLRDAVLHKVPSVSEVTRNERYFPYRYGQAFWAYITAKWGGDMVGKLFKSTVKNGWDQGFNQALGVSLKDFSKEWQAAVKQQYEPEVANRTKPKDVGKEIVAGKLALNLGPVISPDGKAVAFLGQRDVFSIDLYLADARTGKTLGRLVNSNSDRHMDALSFMNAAGTWSPDGKQFAFVVFKKGKTQIAVANVKSRKIKHVFSIPNVDAVTTLAWSPDGKTIVFSGTRSGYSDLYLWDFATKSTRQLTNDRYTQIQPAWSPDGKTIAFATDQSPLTNLDSLSFGPLRLGLYNMDSGIIQFLSMSDSVKHISPQFSPDGKRIYFLSDPEGFSNVFYYSIPDQQYYRVTNIATGVCGLTESSPDLSVSPQTGRMVFSVFDDMNYNIHTLAPEEIQGQPVTGPTASSTAWLPPRDKEPTLVDNYLVDPTTGLVSGEDFKTSKYQPKLGLQFAGASAGVAVATGFGSAIGGGVQLLYGDMFNNRQLGVTLQANGTFRDIGGEVFYLNRTHRTNWGLVYDHIPYLTGAVSQGTDLNNNLVTSLLLERVYDDEATFLTQYPFSSNRRMEFGAGYQHISYSFQQETLTLFPDNTYTDFTSNLPHPPSLSLFNLSSAYVGDYSFDGFTSPVKGSSYRFEVDPSFGSLTYLTGLADYRKYFFLKPFTLAFRGMHVGRYWRDSESNQLTPLYIGFPTLVRGYDINSFDLTNVYTVSDTGVGVPQIDRLLGSRIGVVNAEWRIPVFGNEQFGLVNFPYLPLELAAFFDGGVAWTSGQAPVWKWSRTSPERIPVFSTGLAARVNVLGALVAQVFWAKPFQRTDKTSQWGFLISPGW